MLELRADPWSPDHGMGFEAPAEESPARAEPSIETENWAAPIAPRTMTEPSIWFVDGVRRVELRVLTAGVAPPQFGLLGTFAAGSVRCDGRATFGPHAVGRAVIVGGNARPGAIETEVGGQRIRFEPVSESGIKPEDPLRRLQKLMQLEERNLAARTAGSDDALVLADGRWDYPQPTVSPVIGIIKRSSQTYLAPDRDGLIADLGAGERTPLFGLALPDKPIGRYSWYTRLVDLRAPWHDRAGVVRCEVWSGVGLDAAVSLADRVTVALPAFAGRPSDPRYPQNLAPIAALEGWLQHRMGHRGLVRRALLASLGSGSN
jgi:hypothetical protein